MLTPTMVRGSSCSLVLHYGNCEGRRLAKIPQHLPDNITFLDLNYNSLDAVRAADLQRYTALDTLLITNNQLDAVDVQAFRHLTELSYLDLSNNNLKHVNNEIFTNNKKLTEVFLSGNKFIFDSVYPFLISSSITYLELRGCGIHTISNMTFNEMEELNYLDLSKNKVRDLDPATFRSTQLRDLYVDSIGGIESALAILCNKGIFVHFMMGYRLIAFCKEHLPFRNLQDTEMTTFENALRTSKSSPFVIVTSPTSSLSPVDTTVPQQESEPTLKETRSNFSSKTAVFIPGKANVSKVEINTNNKSIEMSKSDRKIEMNEKRTLIISFDLLLVFIVFLLLLTLMQWLYYSSKLQRNKENVSQYALQNITTSRDPMNPVPEYMLLRDDDQSLNDYYELAHGETLRNGIQVSQMVCPSGYAPERPLPSPPCPSRLSLVSYHEYDQLDISDERLPSSTSFRPKSPLVSGYYR